MDHLHAIDAEIRNIEAELEELGVTIPRFRRSESKPTGIALADLFKTSVLQGLGREVSSLAEDNPTNASKFIQDGSKKPTRIYEFEYRSKQYYVFFYADKSEFTAMRIRNANKVSLQAAANLPKQPVHIENVEGSIGALRGILDSL